VRIGDVLSGGGFPGSVDAILSSHEQTLQQEAFHS
jgi:hypothetical protein